MLLTNQLCPFYPLGWGRWRSLRSDILHICLEDVQYLRIKQKLLAKMGEERYFFLSFIFAPSYLA